MSETFRAIVVDQDTDAEGRTSLSSSLREIGLDDLSSGPAAAEDGVTIDVEYSSLNFKDGLAVAGRPGVTRAYPIVAGIDLVGIVSASTDSRWAVGEQVLLNGAGLSETRHGGYAERAIVDGRSLVRVPDGITARQAAAVGTAGFTAMLSVLALERHGLVPGAGEVLVTGSSGGVGSVAIALLARLGHTVVAASGRAAENESYLRELGAASVIDRSEFAEPGKPLQSQRWAGAVDSVGGVPLANVLAQLAYGAAATSCGLAASADLPTTVMPFILRGVALLGINSVDAPVELRQQAWQRLSRDLDLDLLDGMTEEIGLGEVQDAADRILAGETRGRTVVDVRR